MGKLDGKVAFITGAVRGQGRAHCLTLAREGADIAALDICRDLDYPHYSLGTREQLDEVVTKVIKLGRRAIGLVTDVREETEVNAAVERAQAPGLEERLERAQYCLPLLDDVGVSLGH